MQAKIGSVVISDHVFIPSFAPYHTSMKKDRERYIREVRKDVVDFLGSLEGEVVLDEWVYNVDSARDVASKLKKTDLDLLVFNVPIWPGGDSVLELAKAITNVPLVIWTPVTPRDSLCGYFEVTSDLKSIGRTFKPVFGKTREAREQIKCYMKATTVAKKLRSVRVGQIGYAPPAFVDVTASELDLRARLGVEIAHLDMSEVFSEINKVTEEEAKEIISEFKGKVGEIEVSYEDLLAPAKICVALERVINKHKLDGYALRCSPMNFEYSHPCLAVSRSTERGIVGSCEGDLASAILMVILHEMTGNAPAVQDVDSGDIEKNVLKLWHCGHLATSLAENPKDIALTLPRYDGEVMGPGAVVFFPIKPGRVTIANLSVKGEKMFITSGEALKLEEKKGSGAYSEVKLNLNLTDVLRAMAENGVGHHICIVHGDVKSELEALCEILGIEPIVC